MKTSDHIQKLITLLSNTSIEDYNSVLKTFDFNTIDFDPFQSWSSHSYTRNCLYRDSEFELILLCWEEDQSTSIHGHNGEDCWVYLLEGKMQEILYKFDEKNTLIQESTKDISPQELTFMNDRIGFHKLKNTCEGRSISLHLYAKPIDRCRFFDEQSNAFKEKELSFDTNKQMVFEN